MQKYSNSLNSLPTKTKIFSIILFGSFPACFICSINYFLSQKSLGLEHENLVGDETLEAIKPFGLAMNTYFKKTNS